MKIFIASDITIYKINESYFAREKHFYICRRYYDSFGKIVIFSRIKKVNYKENDYIDITYMIDSVLPVRSLIEALIGKYNKEIITKMKDCSLVIGRCPSLCAYRTYDCAKRLKKTFLVESMGCAWDGYWNHGVIGKCIAPYMFIKMKHIVKNADYAIYVTNEFLQKRYPRKGKSIAASNVLIANSSNDIYEKRIKYINNTGKDCIKLMTTAAVDVRSKGQQYVIKSIPILNRIGIKVEYNIVGEGNDSYLRNLSKKYNVDNQIVFHGRLALEEVLNMLDNIDIYIQPSLHEGLPRSVIEAMSRGCICFGANTAGIPELLEKKFIFKKKNVDDIVNCIRDFYSLSSLEKIKIAKRNIKESEKYDEMNIDRRRTLFLKR